MIMPGVQNPHWRPCFSQKAACIGWSVVAVGEALDGRDLGAVGLDGEHRARLDRPAVDVDGAGAALAGVAADVGAGQVEVLAERLDEEPSRLDVELPGCPIDDERDVFAHGHEPPATRAAAEPIETCGVPLESSGPRHQPVRVVVERSPDGGTAAPRNQVGSRARARAGGDGGGSTRPRAALRLLTARGSSAATRSSRGQVGQARGLAETADLRDRGRPRQVRQRRRRGQPDPGGPAAPGRGGIAGRPEQRLGAVVGIRRRPGGRRRRSRGRPAWRRPAASCRARRSGRPPGSRTAPRGSSRCRRASALPPVIASERCVPVTPSSRRSWAVAEQRALGGVGRRSSMAAGSWTSMSGQPAAASSRRTALSASARARVARSAARPSRRPAGRVRPVDGLLDRPVGQARGRPPGRDRVAAVAVARRR